MAGESLTPMMRQYQRIRADMPADVILFFRLGDFYEMFFEDARRAAPILGIALTRRNSVPMCGIPYHAAEGYLARLMRAGCKVAICEQVEDPATAKGIVRREVSQIITPGTITEGGLLEAGQHHYLAGICEVGKRVGVAMVDLSTGDFWGIAYDDLDAAVDALVRYRPGECIIPEQADEQDAGRLPRAIAHALPDMPVSRCEEWTFGRDAAYDLLVRHFSVQSLISFGCEEEPAVICSAGALLYYLQVMLRRSTKHIRSFQTRQQDEGLLLDEMVCANLDLIPIRGRTGGRTLLDVLDDTATPMGARKLRDWILRPLARVAEIQKRQDAVQVFLEDRALLHAVRDAFGPVRDLARLIARIGSGGGNARDVVAIGTSLAALPAIRDLLAQRPSDMLAELSETLEPMPDLVATIEAAFVEDPPVGVKDGGMMRTGYHEELDTLRDAASSGRDWLVQFQAAEQERTGIRTLKVRHNKVFGYYIEISKAQLAHVPEEYVRKQTLVNAERFITPELKTYENRIMGAHERAVALEYELFTAVRDQVGVETARIQAIADALATLDTLSTLADRALALGYIRPEIREDTGMEIRGGRHPVVEQMEAGERFVPNDVLLDCEENQLLIITGPNMAGKSTYIRQVAVLVVMAQMGSYIPAEEARMGVVDRIFTRVGANDDLARGRSTFMVEMQETANILHHATPRSLIVLDEIGRGTSTFDGISIAWSVAEFLHGNAAVKARTLFATHYHELTELARTLRGVRNYNILVKEKDDTIVFLRKIVEGAADKSYGIQVAKLAGMPDTVVKRAGEILANLEEGEIGNEEQPKLARHRKSGKGAVSPTSQLDLFGG